MKGFDLALDRLDVHPLAQAMPRMLRDEYCELVADIKANGLRAPVVIFEGKILDGRHRHDACWELGFGPAVEEFDGTYEEAKAFVLSLNVHRRHLTFEQKLKIVNAELQRDPSQSDRVIAKQVKVSPTTVGKIRAEAEGAGMVSTVDTIVGADGVKQPKPKRSAPPTPTVQKDKPTATAEPPSAAPPTASTPAGSVSVCWPRNAGVRAIAGAILEKVGPDEAHRIARALKRAAQQIHLQRIAEARKAVTTTASASRSPA